MQFTECVGGSRASKPRASFRRQPAGCIFRHGRRSRTFEATDHGIFRPRRTTEKTATPPPPEDPRPRGQTAGGKVTHRSVNPEMVDRAFPATDRSRVVPLVNHRGGERLLQPRRHRPRGLRQQPRRDPRRSLRSGRLPWAQAHATAGRLFPGPALAQITHYSPGSGATICDPRPITPGRQELRYRPLGSRVRASGRFAGSVPTFGSCTVPPIQPRACTSP